MGREGFLCIHLTTPVRSIQICPFVWCTKYQVTGTDLSQQSVGCRLVVRYFMSGCCLLYELQHHLRTGVHKSGTPGRPGNQILSNGPRYFQRNCCVPPTPPPLYAKMCTEQKAPDSSGGYRSLQICESSVCSFLRIILLAPRI